MNTRAVTFIERMTTEVISDILEQQQESNMNKQYTPLISNNSFKIRLIDPFQYSGDVRGKMSEPTLTKLLLEEHQKERFEANKELPKINKKWSKLNKQREGLIAEIDKRTKFINTNKPNIPTNPELVSKVVQATDESKLFADEVTQLSGTMRTLENQMNRLANVIEDGLVKHAKKTLEAIAVLRASVDRQEAVAKLALAFANKSLKGKFDVPAELVELTEVPVIYAGSKSEPDPFKNDPAYTTGMLGDREPDSYDEHGNPEWISS